MGPLPATDRLEAKQLRMCLLSKRVVILRQKSKVMLDRRCLVEVPNAPRHRTERAHAEADYDEETAFDNYSSPEAGHRAGPGGPINA